MPIFSTSILSSSNKMYRAWIIISLILSVFAIAEPGGESSTGGDGFKGGLRRISSKIGDSVIHPRRELHVCSKVEATTLKQWDRTRWHIVAQCPHRDVGKLHKHKPGETQQQDAPNPNENLGVGVSRLPIDKCLGWDEQNGLFTWTKNGNGIEKGHCSDCKVVEGGLIKRGEPVEGKTADKGKAPDKGVSFTLTCKCDKKKGETGQADAKFELLGKVKVESSGVISCHRYKDRMHPDID